MRRSCWSDCRPKRWRISFRAIRARWQPRFGNVCHRTLEWVRSMRCRRSGRTRCCAKPILRAPVQTMVGVSKDERALSKVPFAVRKRLPGLHVNLAAAFLAAMVVGLFYSTIAQYTALAVLLPVVAGQSGNTGAQALAMTMRGLALREIHTRHWPKIVFNRRSGRRNHRHCVGRDPCRLRCAGRRPTAGDACAR